MIKMTNRVRYQYLVTILLMPSTVYYLLHILSVYFSIDMNKPVGPDQLDKLAVVLALTTVMGIVVFSLYNILRLVFFILLFFFPGLKPFLNKQKR